MTGPERVMAAVEGREADRVPATATLSLYGARLTACPLQEYYNDPRRYAEGQAAVWEEFRPDILFTPFLAAAETLAFGGRVRYFPDSPPNMSEPAFESAERFLARPAPGIGGDPHIRYIREATAMIAEARGDDCVLAGLFFSPLDLPPLAIGIDAWLDCLLFDRPTARGILDAMTVYFRSRVNAFFADGAVFVALPVVFCNPAVVGRAIAEDLALPALRKAFADLDGPVVIHHGGSPMNGYLASLVDLPGVIGFVADKGDRLREARGAIGGKVLLGNVDGPTLNKRKAEEVAAQRRAILEDRKGDPHFILASSAADIPYDTPAENIRAFLGAGR
jgi:uroporphyrinogen decarboxylase